PVRRVTRGKEVAPRDVDMRIDRPTASLRRRAGKSWGPAGDAPTFLGRDELVLPLRAPASDPDDAPMFLPTDEVAAPMRASRSDSLITSAPKPAAHAATPAFVQFEGGASFDPLAVPLPPELAAPV